VINALLAKIGLGSAELDKFSAARGKLGQRQDQIRILGEFAIALGFKCVYVLIDKIDENSLTGLASTSFRFIAPLASDLQVLELPNFGFKFFLWDLLQGEYRSVARPDRVKYYSLNWSVSQLREMLSRRLLAHSDDRVTSLAAISAANVPKNIDEVVALFSQGSPRNAIRLCKEVLDQQSEIDSSAKVISLDAIVKGFEVFAKNYTNEILDEGIIRDLQKIRRADFTVKYVYADVFKFTQQAGVNKVRLWVDAGVVEQIGVIQETKGARSSNHYGLSNLLVLKSIFPELTVFGLMDSKVRMCGCGQVVIRDWDRSAGHSCQNCQRPVGPTVAAATEALLPFPQQN